MFRPLSFRTLSILVLLVFCLAAVHPAVGQEASEAPAAAQPIDLSSPRATLLNFLDGMNAVKAGQVDVLPRALESIYLLDIPEAEAEQRGRELANQLFEILDSIVIDMELVPVETDAAELTIPLGENGEVPLHFKHNDDGNWRFSRSRLEDEVEALQETVVEEAQEQNAPDAAANELLASPRETMRTFLGAFSRWGDGGREQAILTLDLSELDETIRAVKGEELAIQLKGILDRDRRIVVQEIPNDPAGGTYVHVKDDSDVTGERAVEIVRVEDPETGARLDWKFSAATVAAIPEIYDAFADRQLVAGIRTDTPTVFSLQAREWFGDNAPFLLKRTIIIENWQWLGLALIVLFGMIVSRIVAFVLLMGIRRFFAREDLKLDDKLEKDFVRPIRVAIMAWVWLLALTPLGLGAQGLYYLRTAAATVSAVAAVWALYRLVDILGRYLFERAQKTHNKFDDLVVPLVVRSLKVMVIVFGIVFVAEVIGLNYQTALAGVGLGGLAFALAAQDTISNIFGSVTILVDKPFQIGDWVTIGEVDGTVETVGIRSTRVRTFYNSLVTVPNSELINAVVDNYGARRYRRIKTNLGITYDTPPEKIEAFCEGIREIIRLHPYTRKDYFHVYLNAFGPSSLDILLYCFHECPDWSTELRERQRLFLDILRLAQTLGVSFAFPTQTLHVQKESEPAVSKEMPSATEAALEAGRSEAAQIVRDRLDEGGPKPPPVTF